MQQEAGTTGACPSCGFRFTSRKSLANHQRACVPGVPGLDASAEPSSRSFGTDDGFEERVRKKIVVNSASWHFEKHVPHATLDDITSNFKDVFNMMYNHFKHHAQDPDFDKVFNSCTEDIFGGLQDGRRREKAAKKVLHPLQPRIREFGDFSVRRAQVKI